MIESDLKRKFLEFELNYLPYLPKFKDAKILEIGCGNGEFMSYLKTIGFVDICGVDTDINKVEFCRHNVVDTVFHISNLDEFLSDKKNTFDLIIMLEVIYYFPNDKLFKYLKSVHEALKDNGMVIVEVFNGVNFTGSYYKVKDPDIKTIYHEYSLAKCLLSAGFKIIHTGGVVYKIDSVKRFLLFFLQNIWYMVLRIIFLLERGSDGNPTIFSKLIFCIAHK